MIKYILTAISVFLCVTAGAQQLDRISPQDEFAEKLAARSSAVETITCDFVQVRHISVIADDSHHSGKFYYKRENNICLEFSEPAGNLIVMNGQKFRVVSMGKENIVAMDSNPILRQMNSIFAACMSGDIAMLENGSDAEYFEDGETYTVVMSPKNRRSKMGRITLTFDKKEMSLSKLRMDEPSGDYTEYIFTEKKFNVPVDDSRFEIR